MERKLDGSLDSMLTTFFAELAPRLETARDLERELDRKLAHRFNVLDYLREDELGLSRIIADLLNPKKSHGQGPLFLQTLLNLERLKSTRNWPDLDKSQILVENERKTTASRSIDISVHIDGPDGKTCCLAIENKPYAGDQENQVKDYLEYLEKEYGERFLLIYLSPTGEGPSDRSIHKTELVAKWKGRFAIMPYYRGQEDQANDFRIPHSLADWLGECRKNCEAERLRWFLRDAVIFCQQRFGGEAMVNSIERKTVSDFLLRDPGNLETALAVSESWPYVRDKVCEEFLKQLCSQIKKEVKEKLKKYADDMQFYHEYTGSDGRSRIWLYRGCWAPNEAGRSDSQRTSIRLESEKKRPKGWYFGVWSPRSLDETNGDRERLERLSTELRSEFKRGYSELPSWPWWERVEESYEDWNQLVPKLHQNCEDKDGRITRYFVEKFTEIAGQAIPVINPRKERKP